MLTPRQPKSSMRSLKIFIYSVLQPKVWIPTSIFVAVILFLWEYIDNPDFMISILPQDDISAIENSPEKTDSKAQESPGQIANNPNASTPSPQGNAGNTLVNFGTQTANFLANTNTKLNPSLPTLVNPSETNNKTPANPAEVNLFLDALSNSTELNRLNNNSNSTLKDNDKNSNNDNLALNLLRENSIRTSLLKSLSSLRQNNNANPENPLQKQLSTPEVTNILNNLLTSPNLTNSGRQNPANIDKQIPIDLSTLPTEKTANTSANTSAVDELLTPAGKANPLLMQSSPTASPISPNLPSASSVNIPNISIDASSEAEKITPKLPGLIMPQSSGVANSGNYNQYTVISTPGTNSYNYLIQGSQQSVSMPVAPPVQSVIPTNTNVNTIPTSSLPPQNSPSRKGFSNLNTSTGNDSVNNQLPQLQPGIVPNSINSNGQNNQNTQPNNTLYIPNNINNGFQSNQVTPNQNLQQVAPFSAPNNIPGQYIGGGQINTFSNPGSR